MNRLLQGLREFFSTPRKVLALSVVLGIFMTLLLLLAQPVFYRDSVVYLAMVKGFQLGDWDAALNPHLPPLVPLLGGLFALGGIDPKSALLLASACFFIAAIFPLYGVLKWFVTPKVAAWGCLFYILTPKLIRYGLAPMTDGGRWFGLIWMLYCVFAVSRKFTVWRAVMLGAAFAVLALVRAEGLVLGIILLGVLGLLLLDDHNWRISWKLCGRAAMIGGIALLTMFVLILPRLIQVRNAAGYPALDTRQAVAIAGAWRTLSGEKEAAIRPAGEFMMQKFAFDWFADAKFNRRFWSNAMTGGFELYMALAAAGMVLLARRRGWRIEHTVMIVLLTTNIAAFFLMNAAAGRYFYIQAVWLLPFALVAYKWLLTQSARVRYGQGVFLGLVAAVAAGQMLNGLDNLNPGKMDRAIKTFGARFQTMREAGWTPRSHTARLNILTLGEEYGWGYYADANSATGHGYPYNMLRTHTLEELLRDGLPADRLQYRAEKLDSYITIKPDLVVVVDPKEYRAELEFLETSPQAEEIPAPGVKALRFFRISDPAAAAR